MPAECLNVRCVARLVTHMGTSNFNLQGKKSKLTFERLRCLSLVTGLCTVSVCIFGIWSIITYL